MPKPSLVIRDFQAADTDATAQIYFRAVREGALAAYSAAEVKAWVPELPEKKAWYQRLNYNRTLIAERNGVAIGFMAMSHAGYIDLAFVAPEEMGKGIADALYGAQLAYGKDEGLPKLTAHASYLARRFFLRHGWTEGEKEIVERNGEKLVRFQMKMEIG